MAKIIKVKTVDEYEKEIAELKQQLQFKTEPGVSLNGLGLNDHYSRVADDMFNEFVLSMSHVLSRHSHKDNAPITQTQIMEKLHEEVAELVILLKKGESGPYAEAEDDERYREEILEECADIANVAFCIFVLFKSLR